MGPVGRSVRERHIGILLRVEIDRQAKGVVGKLPAAVPSAVAEHGGVVPVDGVGTGGACRPLPVIVDQMHGAHLIFLAEQLLKYLRHILLDILVDDHLAHLDIAVVIVMQHLDVAEVLQGDVRVRPPGLSVDAVVDVIPFLDGQDLRVILRLRYIDLRRRKDLPGCDADQRRCLQHGGFHRVAHGVGPFLRPREGCGRCSLRVFRCCCGRCCGLRGRCCGLCGCCGLHDCGSLCSCCSLRCCRLCGARRCGKHRLPRGRRCFRCLLCFRRCCFRCLLCFRRRCFRCGSAFLRQCSGFNCICRRRCPGAR